MGLPVLRKVSSFLQPLLSGTGYKLFGSTTGSTSVAAPSNGSDLAYILPATVTANCYLKTDGSGNLSWSSISGSFVTSVNSLTGVVILTTTNIGEGTNLYYTQGRFDSAFSAKTTDGLTQGSTNLYFSNSLADARITAQKGNANGLATLDSSTHVPLAQISITTSNVSEGSNLYFTNARADSRITLQAGAVNGLATLDGSGLIPTSQLPSVTTNNTYTTSSQVAMLALSANVGDICIRTDLTETFILATLPASTLGNWKQLLAPNSVTSVNGNIGVVVLTTSNIAEGSNLYYTQGRFDTAFTAKSTTNLTEGTNLYYTQARFDTAFTAKSTTNLSEGTNLYYTNVRALAAITGGATTILTSNLTTSKALVSDGSGKVAVSTVTSTELGYVSGVTFAIQTQINNISPAQTGNSGLFLTTNGSVASWTAAPVLSVNSSTGAVVLTTTNTAEGTNLYYTQARFDTAFAAKTTANLTENTNLYFTTARALASITGGATTILTSNLSTSVALVSDGSGKVSVSSVTATELGYVSGVTSSIQTQMNNQLAYLYANYDRCV